MRRRARAFELLMRIRPEGRGSGYSVRRGVVEACLRTLYLGDWPAKLWGLFPGACEVDVVRHALPMLRPGASTLRVGFVSDLHVGPTTPERLLDAAFARLAEARLDVLLLGGDYVFLDAKEDAVRALASRVADVSAARKFAVMGNHDLWTHHGLIERAFERAGVELLLNRSVALTTDGSVRVAGIDDPWTGSPDASSALVEAGDGKCATLLVLCHSPDGLPLAQAARASLATAPETLFVCGHTHGGHIATPWGPVVIPGEVGKRYPAGLHRADDVTLYVSRGVGGIELPIRAYARPEVAIFDLTAPALMSS